MEILEKYLCQIEIIGLLLILLCAIWWLLQNTKKKNFANKIKKFNRWDGVSIIIIAVYSLLSFYNLGANFSRNMWYGDTFNKTIALHFTKVTTIREIDLFACIQSGRYRINYELQNGNNGTLATVDGLADRLPLSCQWQKIPVDSSGEKLYSKLSINIERPLSKFVKILLFDAESNPITAYSIHGDIDSNLENIAGVFYNTNYDSPNFSHTATYYDEDSYAIMAYRYLNGTKIYNLSHPQLGILGMIPGIKIFGMNPFGWRFMGAFSGIVLMFVMWLFARCLFNSPKLAVLATLLLGVEFMHFTISRIAIIEPFVAVCIFVGYYFLYLYARARAGDASRAFRYLFIAVIFSALALSCKSIGAFMIPAVLIIFIKSEFGTYHFNNVSKLFILKFIAINIVSYLAIYILSYAPFMLMTHQFELFTTFINLQKLLFITQTSAATSSATFFGGSGIGAVQHWWQWTIVIPYSIYFWITNHYQSVNIVFMGNPLEWWMSFPAFVVLLLYGLFKKQFTAWFLLLIFSCQYFLYALIARESYSYYFYSVVPVLILMLTYVILLGWQMNKLWLRGLILLYVFACVVVFIAFYPVLAGYPVSRLYIFHYLFWFNSWHL